MNKTPEPTTTPSLKDLLTSEIRTLVEANPQTKDFILALAKWITEIAESSQIPEPLAKESVEQASVQTTPPTESTHPAKSNPPNKAEIQARVPETPQPSTIAQATALSIEKALKQTQIQAQLLDMLPIIAKRKTFLQKLLAGQKAEYFEHFICSLQPRPNDMYLRIVECHYLLYHCMAIFSKLSQPKRFKHWLKRLHQANHFLAKSLNAFGHHDPEHQRIEKLCKAFSKISLVPLEATHQINPSELKQLHSEIGQGYESLGIRFRPEEFFVLPLTPPHPPSTPPQGLNTPQSQVALTPNPPAVSKGPTATPKDRPPTKAKAHKNNPPTHPSTPSLTPKKKKKSVKPKEPKPKTQSEYPDGYTEAEVSALLSGKNFLIIGGDPKAHVLERLKSQTSANYTWLSTKKHESTEGMNQMVYDFDMVFLLIRWASHSYGGVVRHCKQAGIPLVRVTGGYNPRQIIASALAQASKKLSATA